MKLRIILTIIFVITSITTFNIIEKQLNQQIEIELQKSIQELKLNYNISTYHNTVDANSMYQIFIRNKRIMEILSKSLDADVTQKAILRKELYEILKERFKVLQEKGVKIVLFSHPDNTVFLRVHKPSKFDDDISVVRHSIALVNKNKTAVHGFEEGKVSHAFRNIYPLFDKNGRYLGAVDIAFSSEHMQKTLDAINKIHTHFLVSKQIINKKIWETKEVESEYKESIENRGFMMSEIEEVTHVKIDISKNTIQDNKELIKTNMAQSKEFAIYGYTNNETVVISFIPIYDLKNKKAVAYFISYTDSPEILRVIDSYKIISIIAFIILLLIVILIYTQLVHKEDLQDEVKRKTKELQTLNDNLEEKVTLEVEKNRQKDTQLFEQSKMAAMGEMIGNIAHQWRQPLSVISSGSTGMIVQKQLDSLSDEQFEKTCNTINENAQYLSKTIDDFRDFIKGDRTFVIFNLKHTIDNFLNLVNPSFKRHNFELLLNIDESIELKGHPNELIQCFINIFNNARDALKDSPHAEKCIFIETYTQDNHVYIKFKDNAGGIPEDIMPRIFEPYFTTKHQKQGTGLGLHMTYILITEGMKGSIIVENMNFNYNDNFYQGAEFTIILPIQ